MTQKVDFITYGDSSKYSISKNFKGLKSFYFGLSSASYGWTVLWLDSFFRLSLFALAVVVK